MKYDLLLTDIGKDENRVTRALMEMIQELLPFPMLNIDHAKYWLAHPPVLLRRAIQGDEARALQAFYESIGAALAILPSKLYFPTNIPDISIWRNEWYSEHLIALHEGQFSEWAQANQIEEAYRFSLLPSQGIDLSLRIWQDNQELCASARRGMGCIGHLPSPPEHEILWLPSQAEWEHLQQTLSSHRFWESATWNTVPDGYLLLEGSHWLVEGWRKERYHVLVDQSPKEGAAHEVGLALLKLLPENFIRLEMK